MRTLALLFALTLSCLAQPLAPNDPAFLQSTSPLRRGLVGYWRLEEASGTRYDCSSTGVHLTDNNSVAQNTGVQGNCAQLKSSSIQYLTAGSSNQLQFAKTQPWTIALWGKFTNNAAQYMGLVYHYDNTASRGYAVFLEDGKLAEYISSSAAGSVFIRGTSVLTNAAWSFILVTYDGTSTTNGMSLYVNNALETPTGGVQQAITDIDNTGVLTVGAADEGTFTANGLIDEAGMWTRVLTLSERTQLYNAGLGTHFPWAHP